MDQPECLMQELPKGLLADVLRRLPPRSLAISRCVCKAWQAIIDAQSLLRADLLPHSLGGIFVDFNMMGYTEFFSCPTATTTGRAVVSGNLNYTPAMTVHDHCNGLLLLHSCVANPATRQWTHLPMQPPPLMQMGVLYELPYLAFDPTVSPHYEIFLILVVPDWTDFDYMVKESEWPPSLLETHVFSSRTGCWEERSFVREGEPAGTMADMQMDQNTGKRHSVYWRGELYVHCQNDFVWRISTSNGKYHVIKPPAGIDSNRNRELYLGKSKNGVCCALVDLNFKLQVWILQESSGQTAEWVLKHQNNIEPLLSSPDYRQQDRGPWILEDINYYADRKKDDNDEEQARPKLKRHSYVTLLGFHPFEEIVFLNSTMTRGVAYDLNNSKAQDLGYMLPKYHDCIAGQHGHICASFPYTPCWMEDSLPSNLDQDCLVGGRSTGSGSFNKII